MHGLFLKIMTVVNIVALTGLILVMTRRLPPRDPHNESVRAEIYSGKESATPSMEAIRLKLKYALDFGTDDRGRANMAMGLFYFSLAVIGLNVVAMVASSRLEYSRRHRVQSAQPL